MGSWEWELGGGSWELGGVSWEGRTEGGWEKEAVPLDSAAADACCDTGMFLHEMDTRESIT